MIFNEKDHEFDKNEAKNLKIPFKQVLEYHDQHLQRQFPKSNENHQYDQVAKMSPLLLFL